MKITADFLFLLLMLILMGAIASTNISLFLLFLFSSSVIALTVKFLLGKIKTADPGMYEKLTRKKFADADRKRFAQALAVFFTAAIVTGKSLDANIWVSLINALAFSLMSGIMIIHASTDKAEKIVYRPFNFLLWIIGAIFVIVKLFIFKDIPGIDGVASETLIYIAIFMAIVWISTFILHATGKGDGYMLIGLSLFVPFMITKLPVISLVILLSFYIIAGLIQIFSNLDKFEFKRFKFKEKIAFAPAMLYALLIVMLVGWFF